MAQRKLQQEMDRVFKRVGEGVQAFDAIYEKVQMSTNQSQKEKLEQDLKREIKKLQRLRDQIKTWMGSNDIKDKKVLTEQRKLIESEMERFKACEKEMKTKAYSKEGLTNARLDPREREKMETSNFISSMIEELDRQVESLEAEQENLQATMKKGKKDTAKAERISEIEHALERHHWHQTKMETILRMVENGSLSPDAVNNLQEDIKYYVESNQDADFAEDEELYEELNLDDEEDLLAAAAAAEEASHQDGTLEDLATSGTTLPSAASSTTSKETTTPAPEAGLGSGSSAAAAATPTAASSSNAPTSIPSAPTIHIGTVKSKPGMTISSSTAAAKVATPREPKHATAPHAPQTAQPAIPAGLSPLPPPPKTVVGLEQQPAASSPKPAAPALTPAKTAVATAPWAEKVAPKKEEPSNASQSSTTPATTTTTTSTTAPSAPSGPSAPSSSSSNSGLEKFSFTLPPGLQDLTNSFDSARRRIQSPPPITSISKLLESSYLNCPDSSIADRPRYYHPESPFPTPGYYPQEPLQGLDDPLKLAKMDVDTLFYVFYYRQGTYQQYLAARELKNRSWRFHKRFLTWFQRHEEPKVINNEFEQGTYRYFDFEGLWLQRRKSNFKFEYKYLEDDI